MWPFSPRNRQQTPSIAPENASDRTQEPPPDDDEIAGSIQAQLSQLTSDLAGLRLEWAEVLDKLNRWASRQSARERRRAVAQLDHLSGDGPEVAEDAPGATNGRELGNGAPPDRSAAKAALRALIRR
jgi:hypothetical protein